MAIPKRLSPLLLLGLSLSPAKAQKAQEPHHTYSVIASTFAPDGNVIRDLTKDNFRITLDGKPAEVQEARDNVAPRRTVLVLDMSGSMTGPSQDGKWRLAREAVQQFLAQSRPDGQIALLSFSKKVQNVFDLSADRTAISQWLTALPTEGPNQMDYASTALLDAIDEALKMLLPSRPGDSIYAITDGKDNASHESVSKLEEGLSNSGVRLFFLNFVEPSPAGVLRVEYPPPNVLKIVETSGGYSFPILARGMPYAPMRYDYLYDKAFPDKIKEYTAALNGMMNGIWAIELSAVRAHKGSRIKLEIIGPDGKPRRDVGVIYPHILRTAE